jgi:hypothetical protein
MKIRKRLTYANVMSSLAVFLVLGGATAFAATKIGSNEIKANAILTGKIKKEAVTTSKIKNSAISTSKIANDAVTGAKVNEGTLGQVPSANAANTANFATSSNPEAFAKVETNGSVDPAMSKGIASANVTHPESGVYCVTAPFTPRGGQASVQFGGTLTAVAQVSVGGTGLCPAPAVQVITSSSGTKSDFTFYVALYR